MDSDLTVLYRAEIDSPTLPAALDIRWVHITDSGFGIFFEPSFSENLPDWIITPENLETQGIPSFAGLEEDQEEFSQEKLFFETLTTEELRPYQGTYVAVHGEDVVDSDRDLYALTHRFFSQYGHVPVYITFIGTTPRHFIPGPIIF